MRKERKASENAAAGRADEKEAIVDNSSTATENQSNTSLNLGAADGATSVAPSQGIQHPAGTASAEVDHPSNGRNGGGNADTGQPSIEPPDNKEKIPENRECKEAVGYGRPPVASRFRPGRSGNPGGRPKKLPYTDAVRSMAEIRIPKVLRAKLAEAVGEQLPEDMTFAEALALNEMLAAFGIGTGFRLNVAREIRVAAEGTETHRIEIVEPEERDGDALRRHIWGKLIEISYKRHKLYNMENPELERMAAEAGVDLEEAMGDKKPSPQRPSEDKKP